MRKSSFTYSKEPIDQAHFTADFDRFYSHFAKTYDLLVKSAPFYRRWLDQALPYLKGPRVLEISSGTGYLLTRLADCYQAYAIEYNTTMMETTKRNLARSGLTASLQQADVNHIPYANGSFDSIVNTMAFSGYPDGRFALAEMARVLKPDGRLVMMDINFPRDRNWPGMLLARFIVATGDIIRDMLPLFRTRWTALLRGEGNRGQWKYPSVHSRKMQPTIRSGGDASGNACYYFRKVLELSFCIGQSGVHTYMKPNTNQFGVFQPKSAPGSDPKNDSKPTSHPVLQEFAKNVWVVDGPNVRDMGVWFTTRMAIVKLANGCMWVESPVPVTFDTLKGITELGPVRYILAATPRHVWRLDGWHTLFPEAQLWVARSTMYTLKKGNLPMTGILGDRPDPGWAEDFNQLAFKGSSSIEEVLFFHKQSHTVILDDLIQTHTITKGKPFLNALLKFSDAIDPHGGVGIDMRLTFTKRDLARRSLEKLLSWDFDKLIIAHGPCIEKDAKPFVERAFRWLIH